MKRVCGHVLAGLTALTAGGSMTTACVHDNSTIFVFDVLAPQEVSNGQSCTFTSDTTQPYISSGTADIDFVDTYTPIYLVGNQMVPQGNPQTPQSETSYVTIQGAIVRITDSSGTQLKTFTRLTSGTIPPLNGNIPSFTPISVLTLDHDTLTSQSIKNVVAPPPPTPRGTVRLVTYVRFFGQTTGGDSVESGEFEFPVDVCQGCLISFAAVDIDPRFPAPNCRLADALSSAGTTVTVQAQPVPCPHIGQDIPIDCSQCQAVPDCNP
jgi:hypothetical protein